MDQNGRVLRARLQSHSGCASCAWQGSAARGGGLRVRPGWPLPIAIRRRGSGAVSALGVGSAGSISAMHGRRCAARELYGQVTCEPTGVLNQDDLWTAVLTGRQHVSERRARVDPIGTGHCRVIEHANHVMPGTLGVSFDRPSPPALAALVDVDVCGARRAKADESPNVLYGRKPCLPPINWPAP
jgi:hypothetical protein